MHHVLERRASGSTGCVSRHRIAKFYPRRSHGIERVYCTVLYRRCVLQTERVERPGAMPHFQLEVVPALRFLSFITFSSNLSSTRHPFRFTVTVGLSLTTKPGNKNRLQMDDEVAVLYCMALRS